MITIDDNAFYSLKEIKELFKKGHVATVRRWISKYRLKYKTVGRTIYISGRELNEKLFDIGGIDSLLK